MVDKDLEQLPAGERGSHIIVDEPQCAKATASFALPTVGTAVSVVDEPESALIYAF
jgi:hypothetical protein